MKPILLQKMFIFDLDSQRKFPLKLLRGPVLLNRYESTEFFNMFTNINNGNDDDDNNNNIYC
jgi:hypothetical protein